MCLCNSAVLNPSVRVASLHTPTYAGSSLTLNCTITVSSVVDTSVIVSAVWKMNGNLITSTERLLSVSPSEVSSGVYQSLLQFNPLGWLIDDGNYMCEVDVASEAEHSTFVLATPTLSDAVSLLATGNGVCNCLYFQFSHLCP